MMSMNHGSTPHSPAGSVPALAHGLIAVYAGSSFGDKGEKMLKTMFGSKQNAAADVHNLVTVAEPVAAHRATQEEDALRWFKYAFDTLPVNAMFCDRDLILKYLNKSSRNTLQTLSQYLPKPVDQLVGNSIHIFHKRTETVETVLGAKQHHGNHKLPHRAIIQLGPEKLDLDLDAILDDQGQYIGVAVVWSLTTKRLESIEKNQNSLRDNVAEVNRQLQMVSTAALEIESSSGEVAKNAVSVESATRKFQEASKDGISAIEHLQESSDGVAKIADLIASIATQTSVLALNATIEAARAGVHGKGFSVVASEVKKLAEQTAAATSDIQSKVSTIRGDITTAFQAIGKIDSESGDLSSLAQQLAAAAEEQRVATKEVAQSAEQAAQNTAQIATSTSTIEHD